MGGKVLRVATIVIGSIMALFGLLYTGWYALNWDMLSAYAGVYQVRVFLISAATLIVGLILVWLVERKL